MNCLEKDRYTFPSSTAYCVKFNCLAVLLEVRRFGLYFIISFYTFDCNRLTVSSAVRQTALLLFAPDLQPGL